ncbi:cell division protein FtsQ/DivIB [Actinomadura harenae]|uniref:Cell division protein FtsQ n=1 Tax=Actinomadura harenae TaxID=2483351 RepID=A0A3M2LPK9_9ACTN|nr:FtsQ-type POTRA domain-containing protein [Actinomadura harenae]RMI36778.1 FtsQ-type POTRA domain-containing protein [Actinomadura harenae]
MTEAGTRRRTVHSGGHTQGPTTGRPKDRHGAGAKAGAGDGDGRPGSGASGPGRAPDGRKARRPPARRRPNRWKAAFVTLLVVGVLAAAGWVLLGSKLLVVRHVEVTGNRLAPRDRIEGAAGISLGSPMARLDTGAVRARVQRLREVASAKVERAWPGTIRIVVTERTPRAVVARDGRFFLLDASGVTVTDGTARPAGLPLLAVSAPGPSDPSSLASLHVIEQLPAALRRKLAEVTAVSPEAVTLRLADGLTIVWGSDERTAEKLRLVEALRRSPAGRSANTVDVSSPEVVTTH